MPSKLLVVDPSTNAKSEVALDSVELCIGRAPGQNDIVLAEDRVSRRHAVIKRSGKSFVIQDLDSANGTFVNGQRIKERVLADRDVVSIGNCNLIYEEQAAEAAIKYSHQKLSGTIVVRSIEQLGLPISPRSTRAHATEEDIEVLRKRADALLRLYELSQLLRSEFSLDDIFKKVSEMLFRTTPADRYVVLLKERDSSKLVPFATEFRSRSAGQTDTSISISQAILDKVLSERAALLSYDAQADERLVKSQSILIQQIHSVMCAPLLSQDDVLGVIYVDCRQKSRTFTTDDLDMLNALAVQTSMAVDNALTHDQLLKEALARSTYGRFMPRHVVEQILADPDALSLGGANQVVTTLYSDIRGFTTMSEQLAPEVVVKLLNEYFGEMTPIVFEHDGLLDKYIGDGLMALFGVPYSSDKAAANAVGAAVAMQRRMITLNEELQRLSLPTIAIGIGLNTGTVTVGYIGSDQRTDYTAIGDAVNVAARLEQQAGPWQILISQSTRDAMGDVFPVKTVGEIKVKGRTVPAQVFEVEWRLAKDPGPDETLIPA